MKEQETNSAVENATPEGTFTHKIGNTTYVVGVHFSKTSKEIIEDKIERIVFNEYEKLLKNFEND